MEEEILDIQPLNEIISENIRFQQDGNTINIGPTRELTTIEQKKIYNWDTILINRNLVAYETKGEYFGMNPNLGIDKENFD
ncbi:hypothetical protein PIB30_018154 [Stylosanthes scabra]|uniref:Uncharacterized protein n=1 Tax=Stylosanthes scabra TaxID=79078 RepID=A0ABU6R828_9FABA|nr:hypothetical protein [Stylosanthes scabra]